VRVGSIGSTYIEMGSRMPKRMCGHVGKIVGIVGDLRLC
jgi:hypothetical protein